MKKIKTKATFEVDALFYASYIAKHFHFLTEKHVDLDPKIELSKNIQKYLDLNKGRIQENKLRGIIGVRDSFKNATGGRIHLIAGLNGPIIEAIESQVINGRISYDFKNKYLRKLIETASGIKPPQAGNIHFHLFHCNSFEPVTPKTILDFIISEHGLQNNLQQISSSKISALVNLPSSSYWRPNVDTSMINNLFGNLANVYV